MMIMMMNDDDDDVEGEGVVVRACGERTLVKATAGGGRAIRLDAASRRFATVIGTVGTSGARLEVGSCGGRLEVGRRRR